LGTSNAPARAGKYLCCPKLPRHCHVNSIVRQLTDEPIATDVAGAVAEFGRLSTAQQRVLGADHPDTLAARNNLASWRGEGGDVAGAVAEFERLLTDRIRVLGVDHPDLARGGWGCRR
jgi:Tetratricopeptide repeat